MPIKQDDIIMLIIVIVIIAVIIAIMKFFPYLLCAKDPLTRQCLDPSLNQPRSSSDTNKTK